MRSHTSNTHNCSSMMSVHVINYFIIMDVLMPCLCVANTNKIQAGMLLSDVRWVFSPSLYVCKKLTRNSMYIYHGSSSFCMIVVFQCESTYIINLCTLNTYEFVCVLTEVVKSDFQTWIIPILRHDVIWFGCSCPRQFVVHINAMYQTTQVYTLLHNKCWRGMYLFSQVSVSLS